MEVPPMTRTEAVKEFFKKAVLPVAIAGLLYCIFKSACIRNGELDLLWLWILCGLPFGIHRMCVWIVPGGGSLGGGAALFVLNFIIALPAPPTGPTAHRSCKKPGWTSSFRSPRRGCRVGSFFVAFDVVSFEPSPILSFAITAPIPPEPPP